MRGDGKRAEPGHESVNQDGMREDVRKNTGNVDEIT